MELEKLLVDTDSPPASQRRSEANELELEAPSDEPVGGGAWERLKELVSGPRRHWVLAAATLAVVSTAGWWFYDLSQSYQAVVSRLPRDGLCSASAPIPSVDGAHVWNLDWPSRQKCKEARHPGEDPDGRNWCWVAYKEKCHANLKAHWSWPTTQDMAAREGVVPSRQQPFDPLEAPQVCDQPVFGESTGWWTPNQTQTAHEWFLKNVKVYVLNLPSDVGRWNTISQRLAQLQMPASRVLGVDMRLPGSLEDARSQGWIPSWYDFERAQAEAYQPDQKLSSIRGTLGCAAAHFKLQEQVLAGGSNLAVAFEDDSWPEDDFVQRLWWLVTQELPCDWEVTTLMSRCPYGKCVSKHLSRVQPDANEPWWRCHAGVNWGMHGVLYRVAALPDLQRRWRPVVFDAARPHCLDVDVALASISDQAGYYAVPASQNPGFLKEMNEGSARYSINVATVSTQPPTPLPVPATTTSTTSTATATATATTSTSTSTSRTTSSTTSTATRTTTTSTSRTSTTTSSQTTTTTSSATATLTTPAVTVTPPVFIEPVPA